MHDERVIIVRQTRDILEALADVGGLGLVLYLIMAALVSPFSEAGLVALVGERYFTVTRKVSEKR